jgi:hypothetical protein
VILNRVFSGKYPNTVCGVVYQNAHRRLHCQFTFACDGIPDIVREPDMWERAKTIAAEMLDGKLWLPEVGKATHYHAYWVHPGWVREMTKMHKLGVHTFYRPRAWGDGRGIDGGRGEAARGSGEEALISQQATMVAIVWLVRRGLLPDNMSTHISMSSATSSWGAEWVIQPEEA